MKARGRLIREPSLEVGREKTSLLFIGNYASSTAPPPSARLLHFTLSVSLRKQKASANDIDLESS